MPPQPSVLADPAEERARASGYSARSESEPRTVRTIAMGRVDYGALQLDGDRLIVAWRYRQHSGEWRLCGWLVPQDGKGYTCWSWDRGSAIGPAESIEAGIRTVGAFNRDRWLNTEDDS